MNILQVENPMVLGRIEYPAQPFESVSSCDIEKVFRDVYGSLIVSNDDYMLFPNDDIVHMDNIHTYLEEHYKAEFCTKK